MCPEVFDPTNGLITYSISETIATASYSCSAGYGLSGGNTVRTCTGSAGSSGEWTGTAPICDGTYIIIIVISMPIAIIIYTLKPGTQLYGAGACTSVKNA